MSRFSRSSGETYLLWSPAASSVRIEYAATLFREVRLESAKGTATGVLYGVHQTGGVRVVTARRDGAVDGNAPDARLAGLEPVGIFATRARGELFLSESDLERFETLESFAVALVLAGTQGGFFVREASGAIQPVKSHPEFSAVEASPRKDPVRRNAPRVRRSLRASAAWAWVALLTATVTLGATVVIARPDWHFSRPPLALTMREEAGQLRIAWTSSAIAGPATLEIDDGSEHRTISLVPTLANITYVSGSGDVRIRLVSKGRQESARYVGLALETPAASLRTEIADLDTQAGELRASIALGRLRMTQLQMKLPLK